MLKRASTLLGQNDIAGARLIFQYLANHGSARRRVCSRRELRSQEMGRPPRYRNDPDASLARTWYARAAELGSREAARHPSQRETLACIKASNSIH